MSSFLVLLCLAAASCESGEVSPGGPSRVSLKDRSLIPLEPPAGYDATRRDLVVLSLPGQDMLAVLDPHSLEIWKLASLKKPNIHSAYATAVSDERVFVTDIWGARVASVHRDTGQVIAVRRLGTVPHPQDGSTIEPARSGEDVVVGPDGHVYVIVDEEINNRSLVFKLDAETLKIVDRAELRGYAATAALDDSGRLWVPGGDDEGQLTIIETESMRTNTTQLEGYNFQIATGSDGSMVIASADRGHVIKMGPGGRVVSRVRDLGHIAGIHVTGSEEALVTLPPHGVAAIDLQRMEVTDAIDLGSRCGDVRELVTVGQRAVVTCAGNGQIAVLERDPMKLVEIINVSPAAGPESILPPFPDEPRGLSLLPAVG